jgi:acyl carrier protein
MDTPLESARRYAVHRRQVLDRVREVVVSAARLPFEPEDIDPDTGLFGTGLGLDSIDALEIVISLEHAFGVALADEGQGPALALRTVNTVVDRLLPHVPDPLPAPPRAGAL